MIGRVFLGRYEAVRLLGEGGMGRVYLARQLDLGRQVVIKVMHDTIAQDVKFRERFQRETLLMAQFQHPYAVTLYDASLNDPSGPCIIMEYIKGVNLEQMLQKSGRFAPPRLARLVSQLCEVLQAAHLEGIVHRDLKPANLMVIDPDTPREKIKVMDFGLAKMADTGPAKAVTDTKIEFAVGTPGYISPEQVNGDKFDHRSDLYAVGVILYELLSGQLPFQGATSMEIMLAHATDPPPTFAEIGLADWVPEAVENVVLACLAKHPDERPQSARELGEMYEAALYQPDPEPAPPGPVTGTAIEGGPQFIQPDDDPNSIMFSMDAWMPERIAMVKLRGFVQDMRGEVVHSVPGLVSVKLPGLPDGKPRFFLFNRKPPAVYMDLQLVQIDPNRETLLQVSARFRPSGGVSAQDATWRAYCSQVFIELRGYLMGSDSVG